MPTTGSAYSYAYATVGELIAWIIGWDLFLEFALAAAVVPWWSRYAGNCWTADDDTSGRRQFNLGAALIVAPHPRPLGIRESARVTSARGVKVAICVFVIAPGCSSRGANLTPIPPAERGGDGLSADLGVAGWNRGPDRGVLTRPRWCSSPTPASSVATPSEETSARRTCPWAARHPGAGDRLYIGVSFVLVGMATTATSTRAPHRRRV